MQWVFRHCADAGPGGIIPNTSALYHCIVHIGPVIYIHTSTQQSKTEDNLNKCFRK